MIKTLIDEFQYPRLGPGQMWEAARDRIPGARAGLCTWTGRLSASHTTGRA